MARVAGYRTPAQFRNDKVPDSRLDLLQGDTSDLADLNFRAGGYPGFEHGKIKTPEPWGNLGHETPYTQRGFSPTLVVVTDPITGQNKLVSSKPTGGVSSHMVAAEQAAGMTQRESDAESFQQALKDLTFENLPTANAGLGNHQQSIMDALLSEAGQGTVKFDPATGGLVEAKILPFQPTAFQPNAPQSIAPQPDVSQRSTFQPSTYRPSITDPYGSTGSPYNPQIGSPADDPRRTPFSPPPPPPPPPVDTGFGLPPDNEFFRMLADMDSDTDRAQKGFDMGLIDQGVLDALLAQDTMNINLGVEDVAPGGISEGQEAMFQWGVGADGTPQIGLVGDGSVVDNTETGDEDGDEGDEGVVEGVVGEGDEGDEGVVKEVVEEGGEGPPITFTGQQVQAVTDAVAERTSIIDEMLQNGLVDIDTAKTLYDQAVSTIYSNFIGEQGRVIRQFESDLEAAGVVRAADRSAMIASLQKAGIDPGLVSAELAEIDALYGSNSATQRDYLDNISRIGAMSNIEQDLMGQYIFGGAEQGLRTQARTMGAEAELGGVDKTEALNLASGQASELANVYGGSPDSILAGLLSGVDVAGTLEQRRAVEDAQEFAKDEREANQLFATGERKGSESFTGTQNDLSRAISKGTLAVAKDAEARLLAASKFDMLQPTQAELDATFAVDYKSAMQKVQNYNPSPNERRLGITRSAADILNPQEIMALNKYGVSLADLDRTATNYSALATATGLSPQLISNGVDSGTISQLVAQSINVQNEVLIPYENSLGEIELMPASEYIQQLEIDKLENELVASEPTGAANLFGFNVGTMETDPITGAQTPLFDTGQFLQLIEALAMGNQDTTAIFEALMAASQ